MALTWDEYRQVQRELFFGVKEYTWWQHLQPAYQNRGIRVPKDTRVYEDSYDTLYVSDYFRTQPEYAAYQLQLGEVLRYFDIDERWLSDVRRAGVDGYLIHLVITEHYFESGRKMDRNGAVTTQALRTWMQVKLQSCLNYAIDEDPYVIKVDHPSVRNCLDRELDDWRTWLTRLDGYTYVSFSIRWIHFGHGATPSCTVSQLKYSPTDEGREPELTPRTHSTYPSRTDQRPEPNHSAPSPYSDTHDELSYGDNEGREYNHTGTNDDHGPPGHSWHASSDHSKHSPPPSDRILELKPNDASRNMGVQALCLNFTRPWRHSPRGPYQKPERTTSEPLPYQTDRWAERPDVERPTYPHITIGEFKENMDTLIDPPKWEHKRKCVCPFYDKAREE